jgi:hypothetical protein
MNMMLRVKSGSRPTWIVPDGTIMKVIENDIGTIVRYRGDAPWVYQPGRMVSRIWKPTSRCWTRMVS